MSLPTQIRQHKTKSHIRTLDLSMKLVRQFEVSVIVDCQTGQNLLPAGWYCYIDAPIELPKWVTAGLIKHAKSNGAFTKYLELAEYHDGIEIPDYATIYDPLVTENTATWNKPGKA